MSGGGRGRGRGGKRKDLSVPPGFVSLTSFFLRKVPGSFDDDDDGLRILGNRMEAGQEDSRREGSQGTEDLVAEHGNTDSCVLDEAPLFCPNDEEFLDTLSYIARIRPDAESSGICQILPATSWKTPCLLTESKIWENSVFTPKVQRIGFLDKDHSTDVSQACECSQVGSAPKHSLKSFKKYADDFKENHLKKDGSMPRELKSSVLGIESEFRFILKNPTAKIEVLCGDDIDSKSFGSGFPTISDSPTMSDDLCCVKWGWNLNNISQLPGSLLCFEDCSTSSIPGTRLRVGMCFSTSSWKSEEHRLYSVRYLHLGASVIWYCIPGRCRGKFEAVARKYSTDVPPEQHELNARWASRLSPWALKAGDIPVYRCVQSPGEFVIIFPGSYVMGLITGFNCLESANFAPLDWLPHGQTDMEFLRGKRRKTSISYDKLLLGAVSKAVCAHWDVKILKKSTDDNLRWQALVGKDGILAKSFKYRVKWEALMREHLCNPSNVRTMDKSFDTDHKRECVVCFCDLHLSAVGCSCSDDRFSCLGHGKQMCHCGWHSKFFLFRYDIGQLTSLVEALEGRLTAMMRAREVLGLTFSLNRESTLLQRVETSIGKKDGVRTSSACGNSADSTRVEMRKCAERVDSGKCGKDARTESGASSGRLVSEKDATEKTSSSAQSPIMILSDDDDDEDR